MLNRTFTGAAAMVCLLAASITWADGYDDALGVFQGAGASAGYFDSAYGYALFPTVGKGGIGIGGAGGKGRVFIGGQHVGNTSVAQVTIGLQFGAQATAVAITASASAGTSTAGGGTAGASGGQHDATTAGGYSKGLAVFTVAKGGLMYEASIGGMKFGYTPVEE